MPTLKSTAPPPSPAPLWATPERRCELRKGYAHGDQTIVAMLAQANQLANQPTDEPTNDHERVGALATLALLAGQADDATRAADLILEIADLRAGQLSRAAWALDAAVLLDAAAELLDDNRRRALHQRLFALCRSFRTADVEHGDPHVVTNNHWAVAHAGAGIAALAIHGQPAPNGTYDMREDIEWAATRVRPVIMHHGDNGLYHEGPGYQMYPACFWMPFALALRNAWQVDLLAPFPNLRNLAAALFSMAAPRRQAARVGVKLSWNDDSPPWFDLAALPLAIHLAHPHQQGALRYLYDRLNGIHGDRRFAPGFCGLFFSLLYYPYDIHPQAPNRVLPKHLVDTRQGLCVFRNRYVDGDDAILGCYARASHAGGHKHDDAGSLRFMAIGHDWITGGGQARPEAQYQSLPTPADNSRGQDGYKLGAIICDETTPAGGICGLDLRNPSGAYAERWLAVDYSGSSGCPATIALLDLVDDHRQRDWNWNLTFEIGLDFQPHPDGSGFDLHAPSGATMRVKFLGHQPLTIILGRAPDAQRTFQAGNTVDYPGRPFVQARFAARPHLAVAVAIAVSTTGMLHLEPVGDSLDIKINHWHWRRPFGAAIPETYRRTLGGTLCRWPGGVPDDNHRT